MTHPESPPPVVLDQQLASRARYFYKGLDPQDDAIRAALSDIVQGTATCIPTADLSTLREKAAEVYDLKERLKNCEHALESYKGSVATIGLNLRLAREQYNALEARYNESSRERDRLRQALQFYAEPKTWEQQYESVPYGSTTASMPVGSLADDDGGATATEALRAQEEKGR